MLASKKRSIKISTFGTVLAASSLALSTAGQATASPTANPNEANQPIVIEPVVELSPYANPNDPSIQAEVEEFVQEQVAELRKTTEEPPTNDEEAANNNGLQANAGAAGFSTSYSTANGGFTPSTTQRASIQSAVDTWATALETSSGPIHIQITWRNFGTTSILGAAGPTGLYTGGPEGLETTAARNTRLGSDVNGSTPEIVVELNSAASWYAGSGSPTRSNIDLESVMLHELGHGLGFLGIGNPTNIPTSGSAYDNHVTYNGTLYLDHSSPAATLTSNNGSLKVDASDTFGYKVHAPSTWTFGSSLSHFDENSYPSDTAGALMTPIITAGNTHRVLDGPVLGVMAQIGWDIAAPIAAPTITSVDTSDKPVVIKWNNNYANYGYIPDKFRVEVLAGSSVISSTDIPASQKLASVPDLPDGKFTFKVTPVDVTSSGEVYGTPSSLSATVSLEPATVPYVEINGVGPKQTISWPAIEGDPDNYVVETSTDGKSWTEIGTPSKNSLSHTFKPGTYQIRVSGENSSGRGPANTSIFEPIGADWVRPAPLDNRISRLYQAAFLRDSDQAGFTNWRLQHAKRKSLVTIANGFTNSTEFKNTYGTLTNDAFVELLYLNVFDRPVDARGRATWVGRLNNGATRGSVIIGLSNSAEFVATTNTAAASSKSQGSIYRFYMAYFKRLPDQGGFDSWVAQRNSGKSLSWISDQFAKAPEFQQTYGTLNNTEFVDLLYWNVLARNADAGGRKNWISQLDAGKSRGQVMAGFSESTEFILATGSAP